MRIGSVISSRASLAASRSAGSSSQASPVSVENSTSGPTAVRRPCFCLPLLRPHRHIRLPQRPVAARAGPYRAHEGAFGVELARNLRTARESALAAVRPSIAAVSSVARASRVAASASRVSRGALASRLALAVPATSIAATNSVDRGWVSAVHDRKGARPQTGPHH